MFLTSSRSFLPGLWVSTRSMCPDYASSAPTPEETLEFTYHSSPGQVS